MWRRGCARGSQRGARRASSRVTALLVFVGAGFGGVARFGMGAWIQRAAGLAFPWGTLFINVSGSLLLGMIVSGLDGSGSSPEWRALLGIGFCGGYTTFSTFSFEAIRLFQEGEWASAGAYVLGSVAAALVAVALGMKLGAALRGA
jgi:fluoride exporter